MFTHNEPYADLAFQIHFKLGCQIIQIDANVPSASNVFGVA